MIFDFDLDFAKEAQETGEGKIVTRDGRDILIISWDRQTSVIPDDDEYVIKGFEKPHGNSLMSWTENGKYWVGIEHINDLFIEIPWL